MAIKVKQGNTVYWRDGEGALIPVKFIPKEVQEEDKMVERISKRVHKFQEKMIKFKRELEKSLNEYLNKMASKYGEKWEGNAVIYDFSKQLKIEVKISKHIAFSEKLQIAKQKIDKCIMKWSEKSDKKLVALINKAFKVDKKGDLDAKRILELRTLDIKDDEWKEAMELISDSVIIDSTKIYYNFYAKNDSGKWEKISLNFSSL